MTEHETSGRLLVITGLSGAGKTSAMHALEDMGYFCVDNIPAVLLPGLLALMDGSDPRMERLAVAMDIREGRFPESFEQVLARVLERGVEPELLFLDASTESLLRRFGQTARPHPLGCGRTLREGIESERESLSRLMRRADRVIDTSSLNIHEIRQYLNRLYGRGESGEKKLQIELISFGYARGIPLEADLIVDVRFLPNPHYDPALREQDGRTCEVQEAVQAERETRDILMRCFEWLETLVARLEKTDRAYLKMGFGCTGGKHRSVAAATLMERRLRDGGYSPRVLHRDILEGGGGHWGEPAGALVGPVPTPERGERSCGEDVLGLGGGMGDERQRRATGAEHVTSIGSPAGTGAEGRSRCPEPTGDPNQTKPGKRV